MKRLIKVCLLLSAGLLLLITACTKTDLYFSDTNTNTDNPDIIYYDNYPVDIATYKIDSFITSGNSSYTIGYHTDPLFGTITASAYTEIAFPSSNPVKNQDVIYDSVVLLLKPTGSYYGDTLQPVHFIVNKLAENIRNTDAENTDFYNRRNFATEPSPLAEKTVYLRPGKDTLVRIRLNDTFGSELFNKFRSNAAEIQDENNFLSYLKGIKISTDNASTNTIYYFTPADGITVFRIYYRQNGTILQNKVFDFYLNSAKEYSYNTFNNTGTALSVFPPLKKQLISSTLTANKAYLNNNYGSSIKISFPELNNLKERSPNVKIIHAELVIKPTPGTYSYPYHLPSALNLYTTDESNLLINAITDDTTQAVLTGNLSIDPLYGANTGYTFNITSYIKQLFASDIFNKSALMLITSNGTTETTFGRLVINDFLIGNGIRLKLYVLAT